jgi:DNA-binding NtrC family response regulator
MAEADTTRVLVVEDEALLLFTIADDLRDAGFVVFEAGNADAAMRLLETNNGIDVLFTDVDMPGSIDGLELAAAVSDRWPAARIIITSGHVSLKQHDLPQGGRFVAKPYTPRLIVSTIRDVTT